MWECTELITSLCIPDLAAERGCVGHMGNERDLGISLVQVALLSQEFSVHGGVHYRKGESACSRCEVCCSCGCPRCVLSECCAPDCSLVALECPHPVASVTHTKHWFAICTRQYKLATDSPNITKHWHLLFTSKDTLINNNVHRRVGRYIAVQIISSVNMLY